MIHTILTHPGGSHKDDLLACCVLAATHNAPIVRKDPSEAELDDKGVAVVDIGGRHDPQTSNFDHHHFDRDHPPTCALSLVLDDMGLYEDAKLFCDWLEPAEYFDSRGPKRTAEWLGVPRRAISQLNSPIDVTLLRRFAASSRLEPGEPLYAFMQMVGDDLLTYLKTVRERIEIARNTVQTWTLSHKGGDIVALFLPRSEESTDEPSAALGNYIRAEGLEKVVHAIVYPDRRGEGYGIGRYEDHPRFDFSRVDGEADVRFAHKSGFMCKTEATDPERLKELVRMAAS